MFLAPEWSHHSTSSGSGKFPREPLRFLGVRQVPKGSHSASSFLGVRQVPKGSHSASSGSWKFPRGATPLPRGQASSQGEPLRFLGVMQVSKGSHSTSSGSGKFSRGATPLPRGHASFQGEPLRFLGVMQVSKGSHPPSVQIMSNVIQHLGGATMLPWAPENYNRICSHCSGCLLNTVTKSCTVPSIIFFEKWHLISVCGVCTAVKFSKFQQKRPPSSTVSVNLNPNSLP
jgi:hypothetical protein